MCPTTTVYKCNTVFNHIQPLPLWSTEVGSKEDGCSRDPTHSENCVLTNITQFQFLIRDITTNLVESPIKCYFI